MFGDLEGGHRQPEHFSRTWLQTVDRAVRQGLDVPVIRLHDLRHTHATILLSAGEPVHIVSRRRKKHIHVPITYAEMKTYRVPF